VAEIGQRESEIAQLRDELNKKRKSQDLSDSVMPLAGNLLSAFASDYGGLSRISVTSDTRHMKFGGEATNNLLGFESLSEAKAVIKDLFPWVDVEEVGKPTFQNSGPNKGWLVMPKSLTPFERCICAKMFMHSIPQRQRLASIWSVSPSTIGKYLKEWLPYWGKAGEFLSILHITADYLKSERPEEYYKEGLEDVASLVDGKDYLIEVKRKDKTIQRIQISSKVNAAAARCLTWSTPMGLVHEYTKRFGGRVSEVHLVRLWGSLGISYLDVKKWKDWVPRNPQSPRLKLRTAIDDVEVEMINFCTDDDNDVHTGKLSSDKVNATTPNQVQRTVQDATPNTGLTSLGA
jgi:hypothetical protein